MHLRRAGLDVHHELHQAVPVVGLRVALAVEQAELCQPGVGVEEAVGGDQVDARTGRQPRQQFGQQAGRGGLADRHRPRYTDHERACAARQPQEPVTGGEEVAGALHVEAEQVRQRQVDLAHLGGVRRVVDASQPVERLVVEVVGPGGGQRCPVLAVEGQVGAVRVVLRRADLVEADWFRRHYHVRLLTAPRIMDSASMGEPASTVTAMCGIIGYAGPRVAREVVVAGLRRMEYRGYDSAGVAVVADGRIDYRKKAGKITNLDAELAARPDAGLRAGDRPHPVGHPRRTDRQQRPPAPVRRRPGGPDPQRDHRELRRAPRRTGGGGRRCSRPRPTPRPPRSCWAARSRPAPTWPTLCVRSAAALRVRSPWSRSTRDEPHRLVAARRNSPLVVGVGEGENFVASDVAAFIEFTRFAIELGQDQVVDVTADSITVTDFAGNPAETHPFEVTWDLSAAEKSGYDWFMRKEIYEQPRAVADTLLGRFNPDGSLKLDELHIPESELRLIDKIIIVACGTAYYAGLVAKYAIEHWTRIACEVEIASEFRYRDPIITRSTLVVTFSQSGRDRGHPDGHPARPRAARQGDRDLQHQRRDDPARVGRGHLHPRRPRDRGRLHEGLPHPGGGLLPARAVPGPGPRHDVRRRDPRGDERTGRHPASDPEGARRTRSDQGACPPLRRAHVRCCSSAGTSATRWLWRAR